MRAVPLLSFVLSLHVASCGDDGPEPLSLTVVTFNTGSGASGSDDHPDGYTELEDQQSDDYYGNGLAWLPAMDATRAFFAELQPDIVAFQEIFHPAECAMVPLEAHEGFICESWVDGDPTVAQSVLGDGYQIACNIDKSDKCLAVRRAFGSIRGCDGPLCLDGLGGGRVMDCGSGSRVGRAIIDLVDEEGVPTGRSVTAIGVHGSSGFTLDDIGCREKQFDQVWIDLLDGSGQPGVQGTLNVVLGDFNTDPGRTMRVDASARHLLELVEMFGFAFISEVGPDAPGSYAGAVDIDHVISDGFEGACVARGVNDGTRVYEPSYFDHVPIICDLVER